MKIRGRAITTAIAAGIVIIGLGAGYLTGLRINLTPSYALGIWRIVPLDRAPRVGDRVFICPPPTADFGQAQKRGYLRSGLCPGWLSPLIKIIAAMPGQRIEVAKSVSIDDVPLARSNLLHSDGLGRALKPHVGGVVPAGHLFVHSPFLGSYDSRYFGPIPSDGLLGLAQPVLTFAP